MIDDDEDDDDDEALSASAVAVLDDRDAMVINDGDGIMITLM